MPLDGVAVLFQFSKSSFELLRAHISKYFVFIVFDSLDHKVSVADGIELIAATNPWPFFVWVHIGDKFALHACFAQNAIF